MSCGLKATECAKKRAENFYPVTMAIDNDPLGDITAGLSGLYISGSERSGSAQSNEFLDAKRARCANSPEASYRSISGTFFDPLLYLRVNRGSDSSDAQSAPSALSRAPPSLEELLQYGRDKAGLLVEPVVRPRKQKQPHETFADKLVVPSSKSAPKLPVAVYRFCQKHDLRYFALEVRKTYRSIAFRRRPKGEPNPTDPWEEYIDVNRIGHYRLCHAVMLQEEENSDHKIVVILPHSGKVREINLSSLQSILGTPSLKRMSLTALEKEFGFPIFVCPPFGLEYAPKLHSNDPAAISTKKFSTVIDSRLVDKGTTDCFFDLGIVGIIVRPSELSRLGTSLGWTVVTSEQLLVDRN